MENLGRFEGLEERVIKFKPLGKDLIPEGVLFKNGEGILFFIAHYQENKLFVQRLSSSKYRVHRNNGLIREISSYHSYTDKYFKHLKREIITIGEDDSKYEKLSQHIDRIVKKSSLK